jgi:hypothetical protein
LASEKFLSVAVDLGEGNPGQVGDVQLELHRRYFSVCPMFRAVTGVVKCRYPSGTVAMGRTDLGTRWEAWRPMLSAVVVVGVFGLLLLSWAVLATVYALPARFVAFIGSRDLDLGQCWNIAGAALMPGAALMEVAILLYGIQWADMIGLTIITATHLVVGWIYLFMSIWQAPKAAPKPPPVVANVFSAQASQGDGEGTSTRKLGDNPFQS